MRTSISTLAILGCVFVTCAAACGDNETTPPSHSPYEAQAAATLPCAPNQDGKIDANELVPALGINATYLVSPAGTERTVDLAGQNRDGRLVWAYAADYADDRTLRIQATSLDGKWYAASFPGLASAFTTPIDASGTTEGIYTHDDNGMYLHGIASRDPNPTTKTLFVYSTPITLYKFPLAPGGAWTTTGEVKNGFFSGLPYAGRDTYEVKVDAAGEIDLPDFILDQALRVRTKVTVAPAAGITSVQLQTSYLFECLGEAARVTSKLNETNENFTTASELRRLGLGND